MVVDEASYGHFLFDLTDDLAVINPGVELSWLVFGLFTNFRMRVAVIIISFLRFLLNKALKPILLLLALVLPVPLLVDFFGDFFGRLFHFIIILIRSMDLRIGLQGWRCLSRKLRIRRRYGNRCRRRGNLRFKSLTWDSGKD